MSDKRAVLQLVHNYNQPFLSLANCYARAFPPDRYRVITVYLSGEFDAAVERASFADDVIFLKCSNRQMRGLKTRALAAVRRLIKKYHPEIIVAHRYKSVYLGLLASTGYDIPVIGVAHAFGVFASSGRQMLARAYQSRLRLLGVSHAVRDDLKTDLPFMPEKNIQTQYNCIDLKSLLEQQVDRAQARERLGISECQFVFANVGRLHPDKDQGSLIRAFAVVLADKPDAQLLLVGTGRRLAEYQALVKELDIEDKVRFVGALPEVNKLFKAFDVYVSCSIREPFGMVLIEAQAAGLPVIASDGGGAPEVVGDGGWLYQRSKPKALVDAMGALYSLSAEERAALGQKGFHRAQTYFDLPVFTQTFWQHGWMPAEFQTQKPD